jgi:prevent-host-death family protein
MKLSQAIKPISYLKAHASEILRDINESGTSYVITQNGTAKAVVQDISSYEDLQNSFALLKILAQSSNNIRQGKYKPIKAAFKGLSARIQNES